MSAPQKVYSQNNEQTVIIDALDALGIKSGRLLEIGAYCPEAFSNSRALIENGWEAVLVEPSLVPFQALLTAYASNPKVTLVNAAVSPGAFTELLQWFDSGGDAISTLDPAHKAKWEAGGSKFSSFWVHALPVHMLLDKFGYNYDFINIDVEGMNLAVFNAMRWDVLHQVKVVCIEHDGAQHQIASQLMPIGFEAIAVNGENIILARK